LCHKVDVGRANNKNHRVILGVCGAVIKRRPRVYVGELFGIVVDSDPSTL
jgi:hypothetical protein